MSQVTHITFNTSSGGNQTLKVQDFIDEDEYVFYGDQYDEAVSGKLRQRLRGTRKRIGVSYQASIESEAFRDLFNNIASDLFDLKRDYITYSQGQSLGSAYELVPTEECLQRMLYDYQFGRYTPILNFVEKGVRTEPIDITILDYGFITDLATEFLDYRFITEAITEQLDYGLLPFVDDGIGSMRVALTFTIR